MRSGKHKLIVFSRYPEPGRAKTRMIPVLGEAGAADLQRRMARHTLAWADDLRSRYPVEVEVRFTGGDATRMTACFGDHHAYRPQGDGDLGRRMNRAFHEAFDAGHGRVVIVGADCPGVTSSVMQIAFDTLQHHDLVLGPAHDGGYYLVGLRRMADPLFTNIDWGTAAVLKQTLQAAHGLDLRVHLLEKLHDVDRPEDLEVWERAKETPAPPARSGAHPRMAAPQRLSVIVPTLNEERMLPATLERIHSAGGVETIIADGGSTDATADLARSHGAKVIVSPPGRTAQMNAGAAAASGDLLLFCHADTLLPDGYEQLARATLNNGSAIAGAFELRIDGPGRRLRWIESMVAWRSRLRQMPYGDQAIFMRAETFREIGGYREMPIMEDYDLIARLSRRGRIAIAPAPVLTSARYWQNRGVWRTTLINQAVILGYHLGVPLDRLKQWRAGSRS